MLIFVQHWVRSQESVISYQLSVISSLRKLPTPYTPHPTPYTLHPTPYTPLYFNLTAIIAKL
ncbi:hypothetical protein N44_00648 [Microcystis aeruginosa NIES-44]|uniref:Uncharacterized protein n=1 Tax=Microcystis aeruginosa NIES-44 TaxID=449439 RepID=A0A0A1VNX5_MICAE|nr:hypothetical protein N44_00648 [Microcystis aeruginosa NIES-44]